jgi:outer membrane protein assembly factor BamB
MKASTIVYVLTAALLLYVDCPPSFGQSWCMERGHPSHRASINEEPPRFPLALKWKTTLEGPMYSSPIMQLQRGTLYIGSDTGKLWALNSQSGQISWVFQGTAKIRGSAAIVEVPDGTGGSPEMLFVTASDGSLYALDPSSGQQIWCVPGLGEQSVSAPNYADGIVFYVCQPFVCVLRAVDARTGVIQWETPGFRPSTAPPAVGTGSLYVAAPLYNLAYGPFSAVDPHTGQMRWGLHVAPAGWMASYFPISGVPDADRPTYDPQCARNGDRVYMSNGSGRVSSLAVPDDVIGAIPEWEANLQPPDPITGFALTTGRGRDNVLVVSQASALHQLNPQTGSVRWRYSFSRADPYESRTPQPAIWGGFVIHTVPAATTSKVVALSLADGSESWSYQLDAGSYSSPAVGGGWLYTADKDGTVYAFSGEPRYVSAPTRLYMWIASSPNAVRMYDGWTGVHIRDYIPPGNAGRPSDFEVTPLRMHVSYPAQDSVKYFDTKTGAFLGDFVAPGSGGLNGPTGVRFGPSPDRALFVSSTLTHQVKRYHGQTGAYMGNFVSPPGLVSPTWLFFFGDLYVSSGTDEIKCYDWHTGQFVKNLVTAGSGGLRGPRGMVFEADGRLYVTSYETDEIKCYDAKTGAFLHNFVTANAGGLDGPTDLQFVQGELYVTSRLTHEVKRYDGKTGEFLGNLVNACPGGLSYPEGLRVLAAWDQ